MSDSPVRRKWIAALVLCVCFMSLTVAPAHTHMSNAQGADGSGMEIVMVTFRGCEEACRGFQDYIATTGIDAEIIIRDIGQDSSLLPGLVEEVQARQPDLLVTWGTSVTRAMIGTVDDHAGAVTDVPTIFMIVADPVGAEIIESYESSGRPLVTGTRNRVPEETQLKVLAEYREFSRIGLIYNDSELNAVLNAEEIGRIAAREGVDVIERIIKNDADGNPLVDDIPGAIEDVAARGVDFIYVGSSSFVRANADLFTSSALDNGVPVATAYESMVRDSHALISVAGAYYNVGQLAGYQAERILADGLEPGDLPVLGLDRFTVLINIDTARALGLYPPMLLLRYAEVVGGSG